MWGDLLGTPPGMLNKSEHHSYWNLPTSERCDWLGRQPGMGKCPDSGGGCRLIRPLTKVGLLPRSERKESRLRWERAGAACARSVHVVCVRFSAGDCSMTCEFDFGLCGELSWQPRAPCTFPAESEQPTSSQVHTQTHTHARTHTVKGSVC